MEPSLSLDFPDLFPYQPLRAVFRHPFGRQIGERGEAPKGHHPGRFNVVRCAASKGRSSSRALAKLLSRLAALCVAGGLYLVFGFVPTRLNPADDPTRDCVLRSPIPGMDLAAWDRPDLFRLACFSRCRRWAANWGRLVLLLCGPGLLHLSDKSVYRSAVFAFGLGSCLSVSRA